MSNIHVIEGPVFHSTDNKGNPMFCVKGTCFYFHNGNDNFNGGLKIANTLPDGTYVRVTHSGGTIVRLEVKR